MKTKKQYLQELIEENKQNRLHELKDERSIIVNHIDALTNSNKLNYAIMVSVYHGSSMVTDATTGEAICKLLLKQKEKELKEVERFIEYLS